VAGLWREQLPYTRAASSEKFHYVVIDVQSTMMRRFCYDQLTNSCGR